MAGAIAQDRESCQFPFVLDEKPTVVLVGSAGERSGGAQEVPYGAARSNSERAAPSACVGRQFWVLRLSGIDRLDAVAVGRSRRHAAAIPALAERVRAMPLLTHYNLTYARN